MNTLDITAKSVDEAVFRGLQQMGISIDEVSIEIIQQETKGILGIGARPAIVRLTRKPPEEYEIPDYLTQKNDRRGDSREYDSRRGNDRRGNDRRTDNRRTDNRTGDSRTGDSRTDDSRDRRAKNDRRDISDRAPKPQTAEAINAPEAKKPTPAANTEKAPAAKEAVRQANTEAGVNASAALSNVAPAEKSNAQDDASNSGNVGRERQPRPTQQPAQPRQTRPQSPRPNRAPQPKPAVRAEGDGGDDAYAGEEQEPQRIINYTEEAAQGLPAADFVRGLIEKMGVEGKVLAACEEDCLRLRIESEMMGVLIGHRGETLDAMQYLTSLVVNRDRKNTGYTRVTLNTEDYREKREETLRHLAKRVASQVKATGRPRALEPMNPYERRILHATLQNNPYVTTHSEGEEPNRRVVVTLKRRPRKAE